MTALMLHVEGEHVTMANLMAVEEPEKTDTYTPISHAALVNVTKSAAEQYLPGYELVSEEYGLSPKSGEKPGQQMFAVLTLKNGISDSLNLAIGIRNSYDKSLAAGVVIGAKVFVCDNLCFNGEITLFRKHTGNALDDIEIQLSGIMPDAPVRHKQIARDRERMMNHEIGKDTAFALLGMAYGRNILSPRQMLIAKKAWLKPPHMEFEGRNLWSLHNSFTEALKSTKPDKVVEKHTNAHGLLMSKGFEL